MPPTLIRNPALYKHVSGNLRNMMYLHGLTESDISGVTGIPAPTIRRYMVGRCEAMTLHLLVAIADVLGTTVPELMEGYHHYQDGKEQNNVHNKRHSSDIRG